MFDSPVINHLDHLLQAGKERMFIMRTGMIVSMGGREKCVERRGHLIQLRSRDVTMYENDVVWTGGQVLVGENLGLSFFLFIFPFQEKDKQLTEEKATGFENPLKICGLTA